VLSPGNRAKPCKFRYVQPVGSFIRKNIAIEREISHFWRPHSHLTPSHQRTPTNIGINLISPETTQTTDYIFAAEPDSICASLSIFKQYCLKTRASTQNDSTRKTVFNAKWPFTVICFNVGVADILIYDISTDIATAKSKTGNFRRHRVEFSEPPWIAA